MLEESLPSDYNEMSRRFSWYSGLSISPLAKRSFNTSSAVRRGGSQRSRPWFHGPCRANITTRKITEQIAMNRSGIGNDDAACHQSEGGMMSSPFAAACQQIERASHTTPGQSLVLPN